MKKITVNATTENIHTVTDFINKELELYNFSSKSKMKIDIAIDEFFSNIVNYAYSPSVGKATIEIEITENPLRATITFIDKGKPYNPLEAKEPDVSIPLKEREIGGLGIFMAKKCVDELSYQYKDSKNILTITKHN